MESFDAMNNDGGEDINSSSRPFDDDACMGYDSSSFPPPPPGQAFPPHDLTSDTTHHVPHNLNRSYSNNLAYIATTTNNIHTNNNNIDPPSPDVYGSFRASALDGSGIGGDGHGDDGFFASEGPVLPPPDEMREESFARREWRRQNAIHLEGKEKRERAMRDQIIAEAEEYKRSFYEKRDQNCETNKANNREREKLYMANQEKFHKESHLHYWKAIAEIIPREVATIEKKRGRKDPDKIPSVFVIQGPKPGKLTDLSRMRQILLKLKQNPPPHMMPPPKDEKAGKDGKDGKETKNGKGSTPADSGGENKPAAAGKDAAANGGPVQPKPETSASAEADNKVKPDPDSSK
ncbi:hypothetical protein Godav_014253 [Gossypium davidsonii]|uniref:Clathrin light chain n=1 Tax=Gossypium davidsonii TaxID=34287 RepID=A0A7J8RKN1_GOSDV|nr:hypothetical protein [Gossypium davidsonii]